MAAGVVVIATDVGGIHEQVQDEHSGFLVAQGDLSAIADKFTELIGVLGLLQEMDAFRAEYAKERSGAELMSKDYLNWYREIIFEGDRK